MTRVPTSTTNVDLGIAERSITDPVADYVRTLTVAIRPVTPTLRRNHDGIPPAARFAAVAYDSDRRCFVWLTDADGIGNLVWTARTLAARDGARFVPPDATCAWCGSPVDGQGAFCPLEVSRDCEALYRGRETTWRERNVQPRQMGAADDLPAVA